MGFNFLCLLFKLPYIPFKCRNTNLNASVHKPSHEHERGLGFRFRFNEEGVKFEFDLSYKVKYFVLLSLFWLKLTVHNIQP